MPELEFDAWARLRFAIIGPLLSSPPSRGQLQSALRELAAREYVQPDGSRRRFAASTLERWYYAARNNDDVMSALRQHRRSDAGRQRALPAPLLELLREQHAHWPWWTVQLHYDNLRARVAKEPALGPLPSYSTVRRAMAAHGLTRRGRHADKHGPARERLSYEVPQVGLLWHADMHWARFEIPTRDGEWRKPRLLAFIDDYSRFICHAQWYPSETAEAFVHGMRQAILKAGLPRSLMTDNGSAMKAGEVQQALSDLGIVFDPTVPRTPEQNGKIENFWAGIEGRLMAMIDHENPPDMAELNNLTLIWLREDYHKRVHRGMDATPLVRMTEGEDASRPAPELAALDLAFTVIKARRVRRGDGTVMVEGVRFQLPPSWRHLKQVTLRYARWDLSHVTLVDAANPTRGLATLYPLNKARNAERARRALPQAPQPATGPRPTPPLLQQYLDRHEARGLPGPWLPFEPRADNQEGDPDDQE